MELELEVRLLCVWCAIPGGATCPALGCAHTYSVSFFPCLLQAQLPCCQTQGIRLLDRCLWLCLAAGLVTVPACNQVSLAAWPACLMANMFLLTRLETRTKESNACASSWGLNLQCAMNMPDGICAPTANQSIRTGLSLSIFVRTRKMVNYA